MAADHGEVTLVELLDLSAAFDMVDHDILLDRLRVAFGMQGTALSWIETFIRGRTQRGSFRQWSFQQFTGDVWCTTG